MWIFTKVAMFCAAHTELLGIFWYQFQDFAQTLAPDEREILPITTIIVVIVLV